MSLEQNDTLGQSDNVGVIESLSDHVDQEVFSDPAAERAECSPPRDTSPPPAPAPTSVSVDSFSPNETFFAFDWPETVTGVERIALTAKGDLQRVLSAFFAKPIKVTRISSSTTFSDASPQLAPGFENASVSNPIKQSREVNLTCAGKLLCVANSTVTISTPQAAQLVLEKGYAIGQVFRALGQAPEFELVEVGLEGEALWRTYILRAEGFETFIKEVFADRKMFSEEGWIDYDGAENASPDRSPSRSKGFMVAGAGRSFQLAF